MNQHLPATEIARLLGYFIAPSQYTELRVLRYGEREQTYVGWFDGSHLLQMAQHAIHFGRQAGGVYFIPNPISPATAAQRLNQINKVYGVKPTRDEDVEERRHLIVDLDPRRSYIDHRDQYHENGPFPSSGRELGFARRVARKYVVPFFLDLGYRPPIEMLSGNGIHLVFQVAPQPAVLPRHQDVLRDALEFASKEFSCWGVTIDPATYNASRMLKVPGTMVRRGAPYSGRPFRMARIVRVHVDEWVAPQSTGPQEDSRPDPAGLGQTPATSAAPPDPKPEQLLFDGCA